MNLETGFAFAADAIVRSTAVLVIAAVLAGVLRRSSAAARNQVWLVATAAVLAMPLLTLLLPHWRVLPARAAPPPAPVVPAAAAPIEADAPLAEIAVPSPSPSPPNKSSPPAQSAQPRASPISSDLTWRHAVAVAWLLGAGVALLPPLLGAISLRRLQRRATRVRDHAMLAKLAQHLRLRRLPMLLMSAERDMPMTWGVVRPKLLLPASFDAWPAGRRQVVLLHELAHVARRDCLWQRLGHVACALYWFHPLVWIAARQMCRERERACDDLVLAAGGANPPDYAEHLLHVAAGLEPPMLLAHAAIAMARRSNLEQRIRAILDPRIDRRRLTRGGIVVLALLGLLVAPLAMLRAQTTAPTIPLRINTIDSAAKPVAGVDVYVFHEIYPNPDEENPHVVRLGPVKSDAQGVAVVQIPQPAGMRSKWTRASVFARVPGRMIGADIAGVAGEIAKEQRIVMAPAAPMKGKVTVPPGFAARDVKVTMLSLIVNDGPASSGMITPGKDKWPELFEFPVGADGSFVVPEVPEQGSAYLAGNAKGLGEAQFMSMATGPAAGATLNLRPEGVIEGTLTREGDDAPVGGAKILAHPHGGGGGVDVFVTLPHAATTDARGKFRIDGLPEAYYTLALPWASTPPEHVLAPRHNVLVRAGQTTRDVKLQVERGTLVVGEVIETPSGKPVKDAHVAAVHPADGDNPHGIGSSQSDADGRFVLRLPAGKSKLYFAGLPDGYVALTEAGSERVVDIAKGDPDRDLPAFVLSPAKPVEPLGIAVLRGRVVDARGNGVKGVNIGDHRVEIWSMGEMPIQDDKAAVTDADGRFEFKATAGIKHRLFVSNYEWQHEKTQEFTPAKDQPFTHADIVVRERPVVGTITGVVVDPAGEPVEGVEVGYRRGVRTDANGRFSMVVRGDAKPVMLDLRKIGYCARNWNDVAPDAKEVRFVLPPGGPREDRPPAPPAKDAIGKPAPKLDVGTWIHLPSGKPPDVPRAGRNALVLFDWYVDDAQRVKKQIAQLEAEAKRANADAVLIFGPQSHETGVRWALGDDKPNVAIGIDRYDADGRYDINGATMSAWGLGRMPHAFVVDEKGVVRHEQHGVGKLAEAVK